MIVEKGTESQSLQGKVTQERVWRGPVTTYKDTWVEREREVPGTCSRPVCSGASGKSELWNAYFNAPKEKRADALAKAIEGIGEVSSKALVEKGYFRSKPRNWDEFESEIKRAASNGVIRKNVATMVTENHQAENMNKLGYGASSCSVQQFSCNKTIVERVLVKTPHVTEEETRAIVYTRALDIQVRVTEAKLLSFEKDQLYIQIDENGRVELDSNGQNRYTVVNQQTSGNTVYIDVKASGRVLRDLPGNVVYRDSYDLMGRGAVFAMEIDSKYLVDRQIDPNAQFVIEYDVYTCPYGWSGTCGFTPWKKISSQTVVLDNPRMSVQVEIPAKHKSYVAYRVSRQNSEFFNGKFTYERSTDSVKMPKF